jgi:hypothetical protein
MKSKLAATIKYCAVLFSFIFSCGFTSCQRCYSERIEVSMPAMIERNGTPQNENLSGVVALTNVPDQFAALRAVLTEDPTQQTYGVVWTMPAFQTNGGGIAIALQAPLRAGDVLAVNSAFDGGGWGTISLPAGVNAQVSVRADNFVATSASGSIQVLAVAPLRLRIDIETSDATNSTIRIRGDASFKYERERVTCD